MITSRTHSRLNFRYLLATIKADWHCITHWHRKATGVHVRNIFCYDCEKQFYPPVPRTKKVRK